MKLTRTRWINAELANAVRVERYGMDVSETRATKKLAHRM